MLNGSQDYFGQTVNVAARVQGLASSRAIFVTKSVAEDPKTAKILQTAGLHPTMQRAALRGIADETTVYEIPSVGAFFPIENRRYRRLECQRFVSFCVVQIARANARGSREFGQRHESGCLFSISV